MNQRCLSLFLLSSVFASFANTPDQVINIANNTNHPLGVNLTIPEHTAAVITMTKLKSAQEMLHQAIFDNSAEGIKKAVTAGADVNLYRDGKSPLLWAVLLKRTNAVAALLECDADVKCEDNLVIISLKLRDVKSALLLVKKGADFLTCDENDTGHPNDPKIIPMHYALELLKKNEQLNILLEFIQEMLNQGFRTKYLEPFAASMKGYLHKHTFEQERISRAMSGAQGFVDAIERILWEYAIKNSESSVNLKDFIKRGANPNHGIGSGSPLKLAIQEDKKIAIKVLLDAGADINTEILVHNIKHTPLSYALSLGKSDIVEILVSYGANL